MSGQQTGTVSLKEGSYFVTEFVGQVVAADRQRSTVVSHTTHADGYTTSSSSTSTHDRLFLVGDAGKEEVFEFTGVHLNAREGHRVKVLRMSNDRSRRGSCVLVQNLTTGDHRLIEESIRAEVTPLGWLPDWGFLAALVLMGVMAVPTLGLSFLPVVWFKMKVAKRTREAKEALLRHAGTILKSPNPP